MEFNVKREEILEGNIYRAMLKLGWPVMCATLLDTMYQLTNTFWLGRLGGTQSGNAVAGLQISFPVIWFFASFVAGFAMSGIALVSQYTGAGRKEEANKAAAQVFSIAVTAGIVIAVIGWIIVPHCLRLVTSEQGVTDAATSYLKIFFLGIPFLFVNNVFRALFSACGDTITPLYVVLFSNVLNIALSPVFIAGFGFIPAMGIEGSAIATNISMAAASALSIYFLLGGNKKIKVTFGAASPDFAWYSKIIRIGLPAALGQSAEALGFVLLMAIVGRLPNARDALGGYGIGERFIGLSFIATSGLAQGLTTIIGQNLGAGNIKRASQAAGRGIALLFALLCLELAVIVFFRRELISAFVPNEPGMIEEGVRFILYFGASIPMFGLMSGISAAFNAAGVNIPVMVISFSRLWIFRLPLGYLFGIYFAIGATGVWTAMAISNFASAIIASVFFMKGSWKKSIINDNDCSVRALS